MLSWWVTCCACSACVNGRRRGSVCSRSNPTAMRWGHVNAETGEGLHTHVPLFKDSMDSSSVVLSALGEWLADSIFDEQEPAGVPSSLL